MTWCRWKIVEPISWCTSWVNIGHPLGLVPSSGHQCREFGVIQQVSTERSLPKLCEKNMRNSSCNHMYGQKKLRKIVWLVAGTLVLEKKELKRWNYRRSAGHIVTWGCSDAVLFKVLSRLGQAWHNYVLLAVSLPVYRFSFAHFARACPTVLQFSDRSIVKHSSIFEPILPAILQQKWWISKLTAWCPSCFGLNWGGGAIFRFLVVFKEDQSQDVTQPSATLSAGIRFLYQASTASRHWLGRWMLSPWNLIATMQVAKLCPENPVKSSCVLFQWVLRGQEVFSLLHCQTGLLATHLIPALE